MTSAVTLVDAPAPAQLSPGYKLETLSLSTDTRRFDSHLSWKGTGFYIDDSGRMMTCADVGNSSW